MKKVLVYFFAMSLVNTALCQDSTSMQKLHSQFREIYYLTKKDKTLNYYARLDKAAGICFNNLNPVFIETLSEFKKSFRKNQIERLTEIIFDSVFLYFTKNHFWDDNPDAVEKNNDLFTAFNKNICGCLYATSINGQATNKTYENCLKIAERDTAYLNLARKKALELSTTELMEVSVLAGQYLYTACPAVYNFFTNSIKIERAPAAAYEIRYDWKELIKKAMMNFKKKDSTQLKELFPNYIKYKPELNSIDKVYNPKHNIEDLIIVEDENSIKITITYVSYQSSKYSINGQAVFELSGNYKNLYISNLVYYPVSRIPNLVELKNKYKKAETLPDAPPPLQEKIKN